MDLEGESCCLPRWSDLYEILCFLEGISLQEIRRAEIRMVLFTSG